MSRLISRDQADGLAQPLVALNLCDVEQTAREAVGRARAEARKILTEAVARAREMERVGAARGEKAGYDAGFKKGGEAGRAEALEAEKVRLQETTATVREALLEMLTDIESQRHDLLADTKQSLLELAVAIAERICRAKFACGSEHVRPLLEEVIETSGRQAGLVLRVNAADLEAVRQFIGDIYAPLADDGAAAIRLVADAGVERGGCVAERTSGKVDARVATQINRIVAELLGQSAAETNAATATGPNA